MRWWWCLLAACAPGNPEGVPEPTDAPPFTPEPPRLRRLTASQLEHTVTDLLGDGLIWSGAPDPDAPVGGFASVGASLTTLSPRGVERWEETSYQLIEQALTPERAARVVPCTPATPTDEVCAAAALRAFGRRAWRRPVTEVELERLLTQFRAATAVEARFLDALTWPLAAVLQSPAFLYRVEIGEPDDAGDRRLNAYEYATRLAYLLWDGPPDDALLARAGNGELDTPEALATVVDDMLADARFTRGIRAFFTERFGLNALDSLTKDTVRFPHMSPELGPLAREETLRVIETLALEDRDFRDLLTADFTWVDRRLAAVYDVPAPLLDGFGRVSLDPDGERLGLLGQVAFLAPNAHPTSSSATRRGKFVRETLLCQIVLPPPANVDTSIPEPSADAPTLKDRIAVHLQDPSCAACHRVMDPIGLGLERFDSVGRARRSEAGAIIDPSGVLDGAPFADARDLAWILRHHPDHAPCVARHLRRYATGHLETEAQDAEIDALAQAFAAAEFRLVPLYRAVASSPRLRQVGALDTEAGP